ncbi:unnamed protein product [Prorocentrum cordatum]|uniref:Uncharacterized protein n=1 Tax=Prorocentrum cordatum TaxID=2364126 RepID=A0ABN9TLE1_9DINO|nr:unnamed protein product [Polarella glacialis]
MRPRPLSGPRCLLAQLREAGGPAQCVAHLQAMVTEVRPVEAVQVDQIGQPPALGARPETRRRRHQPPHERPPDAAAAPERQGPVGRVPREEHGVAPPCAVGGAGRGAARARARWRVADLDAAGAALRGGVVEGQPEADAGDAGAGEAEGS